MRILFISHGFQPEPNVFVGLPFAKELVRRGHAVEVLTDFPNYPGGKIYPGYKMRPLMRETMEGIPVIRVPLYPSHDESPFKRMLCYTSFALSASTIGTWAVRPADVAYVVQGPITVGLPACILKLLKGIPFVFHIHDLWPDSLLSTGMFNNKLVLKLVDGWCNFVYQRAAKIVTITPGMKQRLIERGVSEDKIEVIYNWCDDSLICRAEPNEELAKTLGMSGRFNIVFAGNMGKAQAYMAAGRPILIGVPGDATDLVVKANAGLPCEPENPQSIAETVLKFYSLPHAQLDAMGQNGKAFYDKHLCFSIAAEKFERIFQELSLKKHK